MKKLQDAVFMVQGSSSEPYAVTVVFEPFSVACTCPAAAYRYTIQTSNTGIKRLLRKHGCCSKKP